ncbi:hypothetical protein CES85_3817 (plasmid) [Ochrobactrum quorumnocens]|uniref:Uncharacterized protein n=1 Tax=Ochrobactrum quorumnocens TaxID=271865 RepID=A0A248UQ42_9HYPH|nr:hypothetical protein CES85_3817 [[Ochrobactrum] quorumnocens]
MHLPGQWKLEPTRSPHRLPKISTWHLSISDYRPSTKQGVIPQYVPVEPFNSPNVLDIL